MEITELKFTHEFWVILLPLILMIIDVFTGYINAWIKKVPSSKKMREGLGHKIAEMSYIVVGVLLAYAFNLKAIEYFISVYIIYMEIISIAENCKKLGIKLPARIEEKLNNFKEDLK